MANFFQILFIVVLMQQAACVFRFRQPGFASVIVEGVMYAGGNLDLFLYLISDFCPLSSHVTAASRASIAAPMVAASGPRAAKTI